MPTLVSSFTSFHSTGWFQEELLGSFK